MDTVLYGSGEFTSAVNDIDAYIIATHKPRNVAVIPAAAGKEHDSSKWLAMAESHFAELNLKVIPVPIYTPADANNQQLVGLLVDADWIFFSGGDPGYLLEVLTDSLLWQMVLERRLKGALITGSSAGAMVLGSYVLSNPLKALFSGSSALWKPGLGLIDYTIFPHFNAMQKFKLVFNSVVSCSPKAVKSSWLGIDENTAIILSDNKEPVILGQANVEIHRRK